MRKPPPTVRARLASFVLAFLLPTVAAAVAAILYVYQEERRGFEQGLVEAGRALSLVVDRELASREAVLRTLANSPSLTMGDLPRFHQYAKSVAPTDDVTIVLSDLQGQQILNTRRPLGTPLPKTVFGPMRAAAGPQATLVSDVYRAPLAGQYSFAVEVPVMRDGKVIHYLAMGNFASHMQELLAGQTLPAGWIGSILDRKGAVVARTTNVERFQNQRPDDELLARIASAQGRAVLVKSLEGAPVLASYHRSPRYGWAFVIAVPQAQITSPTRVAAVFAAIAALLGAASLLVAHRLGRSLVEPVRALATAADALGRGDNVSIEPTGLAETETVARALRSASASIHAATEEMERRVRQAVEEAEKAQKAMIQNQRLEAIGQLTGGVAHDFNNLLMVVDTNTHLLRRVRRDLDGDVHLARIQRAVATGTRLTRQLLAFSRRQPLRPERVDLGQALPELMALVRPTLRSNIEVHCDVAPGLPDVLVDPAEFELAIINLAVNARDAMPDGGALRVRAWLAPGPPAAPAATVAVEVADSGSGIPAEILGKVFEPFFTTKEIGRGTGLGLSQVYGMATQAGGTAVVESTVGRGTSVRLHLPPAGAGAVAEAAPPPQAGRLACTVLLVEDNPELAEASRELLVEAGCTVHAARSGDDAVRLLPALAPQLDVVLSDIRMPGATNGLALATHLRREYPKLRLVLMTGYSEEMEAARALRIDVLAKPIQPATLLAALGPAGGE